jgi:hypothetical protein
LRLNLQGLKTILFAEQNGVNKEDMLYNEGACGNGITKIKTSLINDTYPAAFFEAFSKRFVALAKDAD